MSTRNPYYSKCSKDPPFSLMSKASLFLNSRKQAALTIVLSSSRHAETRAAFSCSMELYFCGLLSDEGIPTKIITGIEIWGCSRPLILAKKIVKMLVVEGLGTFGRVGWCIVLSEDVGSVRKCLLHKGEHCVT
jgi:hypothetical protein